MSRIADLFVAVCIVVVSASVGMVMFFQLQLPSIMAVGVMVVLAVLLMLVNIRSLRLQDRKAVSDEMAKLVRRLDQVTGDLDSMERRLTTIETTMPRRAREELEPVVAEVEVIGALVRQVVETIADLDERMGSEGRLMRRPDVVERSSDRPKPGDQAGAAVEMRPEIPGELIPKRFQQMDEAAFGALITSALNENRIDIHLQPIVSLPQRKIRFYEALTRMRTADGETIYPADYLQMAEKLGIMPALDNQVLLRTLQIVRRLTQRTKDIGVFCNISVSSLGDGLFFTEFLKLLEENKNLADVLTFEFRQRSLRSLGPIEFESLRAIQGLGFKFSIDTVEDLRSNFQFLSERGFRYAKISADLLLNNRETLATDIHAADLASYFARFGIELIADTIENETQVVDILEYAIKYGQGYLFSPPRPVKSDLQPANIDEKSQTSDTVEPPLEKPRATGLGAVAASVTLTPPRPQARPGSASLDQARIVPPTLSPPVTRNPLAASTVNAAPIGPEKGPRQAPQVRAPDRKTLPNR